VRKQIAVLVNPTSGKGKSGKIAAVAVPRLTDAGFEVRSLTGRDADEASDLARSAVQAGVEALVVIGGDGMVHLAAQVLASRPDPCRHGQ
jgi:diacylglycerol kinase (ATP)